MLDSAASQLMKITIIFIPAVTLKAINAGETGPPVPADVVLTGLHVIRAGLTPPASVEGDVGTIASVATDLLGAGRLPTHISRVPAQSTDLLQQLDDGGSGRLLETGLVSHQLVHGVTQVGCRVTGQVS